MHLDRPARLRIHSVAVGGIMREHIEEILQYWFGDLEEGLASPDRNRLWWAGGADSDRVVASLFGRQVREALDGKLDHWAVHPRGRLALIILLDQFTRMIFRGEAEAFSGDTKALALCEAGLRLQHDQVLELIERTFFYMPLEHAESLEAQDRSVASFAALLADASTEQRQQLQGSLDFAHQHRDLIVRFGRFPHRNRALRRSSTPEELALLNSAHTPTWGQ